MTTRVTGESAMAPIPEAIGAVRCERPQTGAEYLESLRDGREVYIYGERVADVTAHPAFRNTARMAARLFDALHDPERADQLLLPTDTGSGGKTHAFFKAPTSLDESIAGRNAIAAWARITYGWMGRSPDYKAASATPTLEDDPVYQRHRDDWQTFHTRYVSPDAFLNGLTLAGSARHR